MEDTPAIEQAPVVVESADYVTLEEQTDDRFVTARFARLNKNDTLSITLARSGLNRSTL